ncbi:HAD family hydrolase [Candidatus Woesearchaeota archaeon]|nr:HAD family hydrolase [Candidatus Woesearchaeota archaeon]
MELKYKCIVLDHDDTVVESGLALHHKAHVEFMKKYKPRAIPIKRENWYKVCYDPGFMTFCKTNLAFTEKDWEEEFKFWSEFVSKHPPKFFEGMPEILQEYKEKGGKIVVSSFSLEKNIKRDYEINSKIMPDLIYGWGVGDGKRKPSTWIVDNIAKKYNLKPEEILVVDDSKEGIVMGNNFGCTTIGVDWARQGKNNVPEITEFLKKEASIYISNIQDFKDQILK